MSRRVGYVALAFYFACIPLANYFIQHVGRPPVFPGGPHTIPVGFDYRAPSGTLWIGCALVFRDIVQRTLGRWWAIGALSAGAVVSYAIAPNLAWASAVAFFLGELADFLVYTPLADRRLILAVVASGIVGAFVDTFVFLQVAFGSTEFWQGTTLAKIYMSVLAVPFLLIIRRIHESSGDHRDRGARSVRQTDTG